jgi:hypothetical protein
MIADKSATFRYDDARHEYWLGSQKLPHPTGVLARWHDFTAIPPQMLETAKNFGTSVHAHVAAYNNGTLDLDAELPKDETFDMNAIVKGWDRAYLDNVYAMSAVEKALLNKELRYACTVDAISGNTVIDYKPMSRLNDNTVGAQLAANAGCAISEGLVNASEVKLVSWHYDSWGKWKKKVWEWQVNWDTWIHAFSAENRLGGMK